MRENNEKYIKNRKAAAITAIALIGSCLMITIYNVASYFNFVDSTFKPAAFYASLFVCTFGAYRYYRPSMTSIRSNDYAVIKSEYDIEIFGVGGDFSKKKSIPLNDIDSINFGGTSMIILLKDGIKLKYSTIFYNREDLNKFN